MYSSEFPFRNKMEFANFLEPSIVFLRGIKQRCGGKKVLEPTKKLGLYARVLRKR